MRKQTLGTAMIVLGWISFGWAVTIGLSSPPVYFALAVSTWLVLFLIGLILHGVASPGTIIRRLNRLRA